jgi:hypothetical protein
MLVMEQLYKVEVYSVQKVTMEWIVKLENKNVEIVGRADSGRVKLTEVGNVLKIYLREQDNDANRPPLELQEAITKFCEIIDPSHVTVLHWILTEHNLKEIEYALQRRGIPNDVPKLDNLYLDLDANIEAQGACYSQTHKGRAHPSYVPKRRGIPNDVPELDDSQLDVDVNIEAQGASRNLKHKRRAHPSDEKGSLDAVQSFINRFNLANSFQQKIAQPWQKGDAENMLSHICRLENMDPFLLLPQRDDSWTQKIRQAGGYPDDFVGMFFGQNQASHSRAYLSRSAQIFPAIVEVSGNGSIRVEVSTVMKNMPEEEILLVGELHVRTKP